MKKIILVFVLFAAIVSCGRKEKEAAITSLAISNDSLMRVVENRDSIMNDALFTISDISASLAAIKAKEGVVISDVEIGKTSKEQIKEDLEMISKLLDQKKEAFAKLSQATSQLKKANLKIDGLNKLVEQLKAELEDRDRTINSMLGNIDNLKQQIVILSKDVERVNRDNAQLDRILTETTDNLNTAYYIVGNEKELIASGILEKKGSIGRTLVVNPNVDKSKLVKIDIRSLDRIEIKGKKVEIIGSIPTSSYTLIEGEGRKAVESLIIDDKAEFWKNSKVLVISYK